MSKASIDIIKEFTSNGYKCVVKRISYEQSVIREHIRNHPGIDMSGRAWWYAGYVYIPQEDKFYLADIDALEDVDDFIHGGITYLENEDNCTVVGFDCGHLGDGDDYNSLDFVVPHLHAVANILRYANEKGE